MKRHVLFPILLILGAGLTGCHGTRFAYRDSHTSIRVGGGHGHVHGHHRRPWRCGPRCRHRH